MHKSNMRVVAQNELAAEGEVFTEVKALDARFSSFADALFSYQNAAGYDKPESKRVNATMVHAFCRALQIPVASTNTDHLLTGEHYFESDAWLFNYLEEKGYERLGHGTFILLDEWFRPIAHVDLDMNYEKNISFEIHATEQIVVEFRALVKEHIRIDEKTEKKSIYVEVIKGGGGGMEAMMGGGGLRLNTGRIDNARIALPEYYPYLDGGIEALLKEFIESDECVLVLMGPPGTGKTSLVAAGIEALDLLPIYAKRADAIADKDFVNFIFKASDEYMSKIAGTEAKARSDLFKERLAKDREFFPRQVLIAKEETVEMPKVPIIVVEDADLLLAPRSSGNLMMSELLNETDGIASNHTRKIIFTTNLQNTKGIDEALIRPGRCYDVVNCRLLTPSEAAAARHAHGLPDFDVVPQGDISLAEALRKPRKKIVMSAGKASLGFGGK